MPNDPQPAGDPNTLSIADDGWWAVLSFVVPWLVVLSLLVMAAVWVFWKIATEPPEEKPPS